MQVDDDGGSTLVPIGASSKAAGREVARSVGKVGSCYLAPRHLRSGVNAVPTEKNPRSNKNNTATVVDNGFDMRANNIDKQRELLAAVRDVNRVHFRAQRCPTGRDAHSVGRASIYPPSEGHLCLILCSIQLSWIYCGKHWDRKLPSPKKVGYIYHMRF